MLQEIKIRNFLSFKEETTLSFEANRETTLEENQVVKMDDGVRLLRFIMILGPNASGKSNLLEAINFLHTFWFQKRDDIDELTNAIPFKFDRKLSSEPSAFELKFYVNGKRYWYQVSLDNQKVYYEKLFYYKTVQPSLIFSRELVNDSSVVTFNATLTKVSNALSDEINLRCLNNLSFFAARNQVNGAIPYIDEVRDWMRTTLMPVIRPRVSMMDYASKKISENADLKKYLLKFVHNADFNITGMNSHEDDNAIPLYIDSNNSKEKEKKSFIIHRTDTDFEHTIQTEEGLYTFTLPSRYQSEGTQRIFGLETAIYECTTKNRILMVDEMENSLHPDLVERVIKDYLQKGESSSQLLITTHYDLLLNSISKDFRKDAIWFTEKNADGGSKLYPLIKYSGLNKMSSYQKVYRNGGFGAIPKR